MFASSLVRSARLHAKDITGGPVFTGFTFCSRSLSIGYNNVAMIVSAIRRVGRQQGDTVLDRPVRLVNELCRLFYRLA